MRRKPFVVRMLPLILVLLALTFAVADLSAAPSLPGARDGVRLEFTVRVARGCRVCFEGAVVNDLGVPILVHHVAFTARTDSMKVSTVARYVLHPYEYVKPGGALSFRECWYGVGLRDWTGAVDWE